MMFKRYEKNPILAPIKEHPWEAYMVYNCGTLYEAGRVHILYRAQGEKGGISSIGYASSSNGFDIDERLPEPVLEANINNEFENLGYEDSCNTSTYHNLIIDIFGDFRFSAQIIKTYFGNTPQ